MNSRSGFVGSPRGKVNTASEEPNKDAGRVRSRYGNWPQDLTVVEGAVKIAMLSQSSDPDDRVQAYELASELQREIVLPDDCWVVFSLYRDGWGGEGRAAVWSAHYTEEEAKAWHKAWDEHWKSRGRDNYITYYATIEKLKKTTTTNRVSPHYLRRPDADPKTCVEM